MFVLFLFVALLAALFLLPGKKLKKAGINLPDQSARKRLWQIILFISLIMMMLSLRLAPFALIIFLVGLGVIGNSLWQDHMKSAEDLDEQDIPRQPSPRLSSKMTVEEAWEVLGLSPDAQTVDIDAAYRRLMGQIHPDKGGTDYLAAKINEARDLLKKELPPEA
ncbi:DnaJ domain-containing protein [Parvularcula sp. IMCC14364]|uniref:DnaJ domain-containing protein n=1 Tax=Parvularcula sp. IMCC14364 TaxID=3067902 RepID=UPI0027408E0D|nr:DnaJ domain-containing protein [Parvularcula sp. IMCC14364]